VVSHCVTKRAVRPESMGATHIEILRIVLEVLLEF
jgi:hypothetical protein